MIAGGLSHDADVGARAWAIEPILAFAREVLSEIAKRPATRAVMLCLPAPRARLTCLFDLPGATESAFLWQPPSGSLRCPPIAGFGVARRFDLAPDTEPSAVARLGAKILAEIEVVAHPALSMAPPMIAPRFFGGVAFDGRSAANGAPWGSFGAGSFILPRWTYAHGEGDSAALSCVLGLAEETKDVDLNVGSILESLRATYRGLLMADARMSPCELEAASPVSVSETPVDVFSAQVEAIRSGIRAGRFGKVVAARRSVVHATRPISVGRTMDALAQAHPGTLKFAFSRGDSVFVGASPELLVSRHGLDVRSEAVAGTIVTTEPDAAQRLFESQKDREEHAFVVDHLVERLSSFCDASDSVGLVRRAEPLVRRHGAVAHLVTSLTGQLSAPVHVLDLVKALHPTPAVCGSPPEAAAAFIRENEPDARGWYSGPVGWFDAHGQGEFWVALRSGVLRGPCAYLFAGAGIVGRSSPAAEYEETGLKFSTLLRALKVESFR
ncbi:MAG: isochorismate synthase [Deltaproteobacteria bacterium]|nr:isochorismate synthase [Deltaproteobacteria bacterium]